MKFENNIILTTKPFKFIIANQKDYLIINPLTKIKDIINFSKTNAFQNYILEINKALSECINEHNIEELKKQINQIMKFNFVDSKIESNKFLKYFFEETEELISRDSIEKILAFLEEYSTKNIDIILMGFDDVSLLMENHFSLLNLNIVINELTMKNISWQNLELLVFNDQGEYIEIHSKEKLLNWLEYKTNMVLSTQDLNSYLKGDNSMNSFLIDKAFKIL